MFSSHLLSPQRDKLSPCEVEGSLDKPVDLAYRSHIRRPFDGTIRLLYIGHIFSASEKAKLELKHKTKSLTFFHISPTSCGVLVQIKS